MQTARNLRPIFVGFAIYLVIGTLAMYFMGRRVITANAEIFRQRETIDRLLDLMSTVKDAETGQRGFLLTGEERYLGPYNAAISRVQQDLGQLDGLVSQGELPASDVRQLRELVDEKLRELGDTVRLRREKGGADGATAIVRTNVGENLMEKLRNFVGELVSREESHLQDARSDFFRVSNYRTLTFIVTAIAGLFFIAWAYQRVAGEVERRYTAGLETQRQKNLLEVTLASIGDGVIITDLQGRITFMNRVAETLTGWSATEANQRPCREVFKIVSETTREPVEGPVELVLKNGSVVGLANHTVLIRKDGTELAIDDSGAPIRDLSGALHGVVLVFRDFTERREAQRRLQAAKNDAETASKAKDRFLAMLSHELRMPLTPVLATLAAWEAGHALPAPFDDDIHMLRRNVELEARLIDDLLDLTRIVRGQLLLNLELVDVHGLIQSVMGMYRSEILGKRLKVAVELKAAEHYVNADPARLHQILWNIVKNAAKFTPEGGTISIATSNGSATDGESIPLLITIADNGIGMTPAVLAKLFSPFQQAEPHNARYGGLGLGMAIAKALVDVHEGTISATSAGTGKGSTFTVTLPTVAAPTGTTPTEQTPASSSPPRSLRILLVEDHADTARTMARLLRRLGHEVKVGESYASAVQLARGEDFDLILSDIGLPDGTGLDLIRELRQDLHKTTPAIALTGYGMEEDIARCREAGFNQHLTKPVNFQKLQVTIEQIAGNGKQTA